VTTAIRLSLSLTLTCAALLLSAQSALATCMTNCQGELVGEGCETIDPTSWPPSLVLQATVSCETCCSAPGGPSNCSDDTVDTGSLQVTQDGEAVEGEWQTLPAGDVCPEAPVFQFWPHLAPGDYQLVSSQGGFNLILAEFTVSKPPCTSDSECMLCEACMADGCTYTGTPACTTDDDCPQGQLCYVSEEEPCNNLCGDPTPPPCETDADCGPCDLCQEDGSCITPPGLPPECYEDADCGEGMVCVSDGCTTQCEEPTEPSEPTDAEGSDTSASDAESAESDAQGPGPEPDTLDPEPTDATEASGPEDAGATDEVQPGGEEAEADAPGEANEGAVNRGEASAVTGAAEDEGGCSPAPQSPGLPSGLLMIMMLGLITLRRGAMERRR